MYYAVQKWLDVAQFTKYRSFKADTKKFIGKSIGWIFEFSELEVLEDIVSHLVTMLDRA